MTRGAAIEYDFEKSPYRAEYDGITFVFSSKLHVEKFLNRVEEQRRKINESLSNRFNVDVSYNVIADIMLYKTIEQRGFLIITDGGEKIKCLNNIKLNGVKLMKRKQEKQ